MASNPDQSESSHHGSPDPLNRLRSLRVRPDRARGLDNDLEIQMQSVKKISQSESAANQAWETVVPDQIRDCTHVAGLKSGKLVVLVPTAAQRFLVNRWLASGGLSSLQALARVPMSGVELRLGTHSASPEPAETKVSRF